MKLDERIDGKRIYLERMPKTFKMANELFELVQANKDHLFPFGDWELFAKIPEDSYDRIATQNKNWDEGTAYTYGIFDKESNKLIGIIFACHFSIENKNTEMGYWIDHKHTGKGIMKEAVTTLENELYKKGIIKTTLKIDTENTKSEKTAKSLGYEYEGTVRKDQFIHTFNELRDFKIYAKIKE